MMLGTHRRIVRAVSYALRRPTRYKDRAVIVGEDERGPFARVLPRFVLELHLRRRAQRGRAHGATVGQRAALLDIVAGVAKVRDGIPVLVALRDGVAHLMRWSGR